MDDGLQTLRDVVNGATLSAETRQSVLRSIDQMPSLYRELDRTYDIRYRDGIVRLVEGMLHTLGQQNAESADASKVAADIVSYLGAMHLRLGIPSLGLKPPAQGARKRKA
jgi:hypothetical protein